MEGNIAATYTLIYRFLRQQSQHKAAEAVKKAAKPIVVLRDDVGQEGPPLEDIVKEWKTKKNTKSGNVGSSSEDSDSSDDPSSGSEDDSSSDSGSQDTSGSESDGDDTNDSDDDSDESGETTTAKKLPQKAVERDSSATLSSAEEKALEILKQFVQRPKKKSTKDKNKGSESDSSESDSSDSDSSSKSSASDRSDAKPSASSSSSSSSSDSGNEDETNVNEKTTGGESPSTSESSSESEDESDSESQRKEDAHVAKKRKTSDNGVAVMTAVTTGSQYIPRASRRKENPPPKAKERFQRVKVQDLAPDLLLNNGYEAKGGVANDYGERAHRDLIVTRGAGFRKEKNKKKRGSYRGGEITMESHSIKFDF